MAASNLEVRKKVSGSFNNESSLVRVRSQWNIVDDKPTTFTPSSHTHGNINNDGTFQYQDLITPNWSNDVLLIADASDGLVMGLALSELDNRYLNEGDAPVDSVDGQTGAVDLSGVYSVIGHTHTKSQITDFPTSMPASDVYAWAKESTKPSYSYSEITGNIPAIAVTDIHTTTILQTFINDVYSLDITGVQEGDMVICTNENRTYVHNGGSAGTIADFTLLRTPLDAVTSVAGKTGVVTLVKGDVGLGNVDNTADANKSVSYAVSAGTLTSLTSTVTELNKLDGFTGDYLDLNYAKALYDTGVTSTEFDYLDGVTSNIQTQLNNKLASGTTLDGIGDGTSYVRMTPAERTAWNAKQNALSSLSLSEITTGTDTTQKTISAQTLKQAIDALDDNTTYTLSSFGITSTATELNYTDGVTSNIQTQLNGKLSTSGKAADSNLLDGIDSSRVIYGDNANKTTNVTSVNGALASGIYDGSSVTGSPTSTWYTYLNMRHNNTSNNYGGQLAMSFYDTQNVYVRNINNGTYGAWAKLWNSSNDGADSGLDADLLDGNHASAFALASHTHSYLPLSGGTMTGSIALSNNNITGVNQLEINDPGEGIVFKGGASGDVSLAIVDDSLDVTLKLNNGLLHTTGGLSTDADVKTDALKVYNGTTQVGELTTADTTWFRINQNVAKDIYTPRMFRADGGLQVDAKWVVSADGNNLYENSVALSSKYLGISATATNADKVDNLHMWSGTQAEYNAIGTKDSNTIYFVTA